MNTKEFKKQYTSICGGLKGNSHEIKRMVQYYDSIMQVSKMGANWGVNSKTDVLRVEYDRGTISFKIHSHHNFIVESIRQILGDQTLSPVQVFKVCGSNYYRATPQSVKTFFIESEAQKFIDSLLHGSLYDPQIMAF